MRNYKVAILNIGDEVSIGQVVNTNGSWMADQFSSIGAEVIRHSVIKDNPEDIKREIDYVSKLADMTVMTGGLGPTKDDITKKVLTEHFKDELILENDIIGTLKTFFSQRNKQFRDRHKEQAKIPSKADYIINNIGTAPGLVFNQNGSVIIALPGVPIEMKSMVENAVLPMTVKQIKDNGFDLKIYKTIKTHGIVEAHLADKIGDLDFLGAGNSLAFLPSFKGVRLRINVNASDYVKGQAQVDRIIAELQHRAGKYIYGFDHDELVEKVLDRLKEHKLTVSVAESCTGGLLGGEFTSVPGSSDSFSGGMITYSNYAKINNLWVDPKTIEKHGAVSEETAIDMARKIRKIFESDIGISITGIAGPDGGTEEKPVGTVWIGLAFKDRILTKLHNFGNHREQNRRRAVQAALTMLYFELKGKEK